MAYSMDLRYRVVEAYERGEGSMQQLAERFRVNVSSVFDWIVRMRETGE
jgi:transposase